jgi:hypothetical protein
MRWLFTAICKAHDYYMLALADYLHQEEHIREASLLRGRLLDNWDPSPQKRARS